MGLYERFLLSLFESVIGKSEHEIANHDFHTLVIHISMGIYLI